MHHRGHGGLDTPGVGVEPGTNCWLWESVLIRDGEAIAHLQENISAGPVSFSSGSAAAAALLEPGTNCWLWESVLIRDGEAIAHLQENISAGPVSFSSGSAAAALLELDDDGGTTLLAALTKVGGRVSGRGECQIGLSQVGPTRAKLLELRAPDPILVLTQYVRHVNRPFYLAKG